MTEAVQLEIHERVATLTLNRPDKLNALSDDMVDLVVAALRECARNDAVRAVLVTGAGKGFCAGGDVSRMGGDSANNPPVTAKTRLWERIHHIPMIASEIDKPIVAAVNGVAAGLGLDLACMCDIRIAARSARFCASYARIGLVPGGGGGWLLPRLVGPSRALELLWTADIIDAQRALDLGLVSEVVEDEQLLSTAAGLAARLAHTSPLAVQLTKRSLLQALDTDLDSHLDQLSSHMAVVRTSRDHLEAVAAYKEKRAPVFEGR